MAPFADPAVWSDEDSMEDNDDDSVPDLVDDESLGQFDSDACGVLSLC